jgi:hypothetical protein
MMLSECVHLGKLKSLLDHGKNQTRDLWFASPMLYHLSRASSYINLLTKSSRRYFVTQSSSFDISCQVWTNSKNHHLKQIFT